MARGGGATLLRLSLLLVIVALTIGCAVAGKKSANGIAAALGAAAAGKLASGALVAGVGTVGVLGAGGLLKVAAEMRGARKRVAEVRGERGAEKRGAEKPSSTVIDVVGSTTRSAARALGETAVKLSAAVEAGDLVAASAAAAEAVQRAAEAKAVVDERLHLQENAQSAMQLLRPPSRRDDRCVLLLPNDERADVLDGVPREVRLGLADLPGGVDKADSVFMAQVAEGCRQFLLGKGGGVLDLAAAAFQPAHAVRFDFEASMEFERLLAHLLQRSLPGRNAAGRVAREQALLIAASVLLGATRRCAASRDRVAVRSLRRPPRSSSSCCRISRCGRCRTWS